MTCKRQHVISSCAQMKARLGRAIGLEGAVQRVLLHQRATDARELPGCINLARTSAMRQHGQLALRSLASLSENGAGEANSDKGDLASLGAALWQADPGWLRLMPVCQVARGEPFASQQGTGRFSMRARGRGTCVRRMGLGARRPSPRRRRPNWQPYTGQSTRKTGLILAARRLLPRCWPRSGRGQSCSCTTGALPTSWNAALTLGGATRL